MFSACDAPAGNLPGTHCRMDGFDQERSRRRPQESRVRLRSAPRQSKPYFDMAHEWVLADHMFQSHLDESFVAHQYIIAAQAASERQPAVRRVGLRGRQATTKLRSSTKTGRSSENGSAPVSTIRRSATSSTTPGLTWRFYTSQVRQSGDGRRRWSSYQAVNHIYNGPDWKKDVIYAAEAVPQRRPGRHAGELHVDHAGLHGFRSRELSGRLRTVVGCGARQRGRREQVLELDRDLRPMGRLGRPLRSRCAAASRLRRPRLPRAAARHLAVRESRTTFRTLQYETASVLRFAEDLWGLPQMAPADRRANSPANDAFDFTQSPQKFRHIKAPLPPKFFEKYFPSDYWAPDYE